MPNLLISRHLGFLMLLPEQDVNYPGFNNREGKKTSVPGTKLWPYLMPYFHSLTN